MEKTSWLVKGYPYSINIKDPTPADNKFLPSHIWVNAKGIRAFILDSVVGGVATWSPRPPDYIKNEGTEYQINVVERVPTGTGTTGAPPTITGLPNQSGHAGEFLTTDGDRASWAEVSGGAGHTQGTDQTLDAGGENEVSAAQTKAAYDHSVASHAPADAVSLSTVKEDSDISSAVSLKHTQGTDQGLDTGGENAVTAAQAKAAYSHSTASHAPSDAVSLSTVKADTDIASAISLKHAQGTDQGLDTGGVNAVTAAEVKGAVTNSHAPGSDDQDLSGLVEKVAGSSLVPDTEIAKIHAAGSDDQDLSGLVEKVAGHSLVADTEIAKIHAPGSDNQDLSGLVTKVAASPDPSGFLPEYDATGNLVKSAKQASDVHAAATVSGNGLQISGQQLSLNIGTGATQVAAGDHNHSGVYDPAGTGDSEASAHVSAHEGSFAHADIATNSAARHAQGTDTALGVLGTKNPPIDADKVVYRDSTASDALVTSTWTQVKAFLKTYFDTLYNLYVHPNHTGDVTSVADGATTIANKQTLTGSAPVSISNAPTVIASSAPAVGLVNNAVSPAAVTAIDIDGTLAGNSDTLIPTQKAVKTYADTKTTLAAVKSDVDIASAISLKHAAVTLAAGATSNILSLSTQELSVKTQNANLVLAGPTSGAAAAPTFRALTADDIPSLSGLYLPLSGGTMTGNIVMGNGGTIGQAAGPLLTFDDTNNYLEITGCNVGIGTDTPLYPLHVVGKLRAAATITNTTGWGQYLTTTHVVTDGTRTLYGTEYQNTLNISGGSSHTVYGFLELIDYNLSNNASVNLAHGAFIRSDFYGASPTGTISALNELTLGGAYNGTTGTPSITVTTRRGLYITNQSYIGSGITIDTSVGLDIGNQSGATNVYAIRTGTGIVQIGDYVTTVGGIHVGGTANPGTDNLLVDGTGTITGAFGCNGKTAQTAYASGGALSAYSTGSYGYDSAAHAQEIHTLLGKIRAALVANGILS